VVWLFFCFLKRNTHTHKEIQRVESYAGVLGMGVGMAGGHIFFFWMGTWGGECIKYVLLDE
jgi:hypothetical protein